MIRVSCLLTSPHLKRVCECREARTTPLFRLVLSGAPRSSTLGLEQGGNGGGVEGWRWLWRRLTCLEVNGVKARVERSVGFQKEKAKGLHCVEWEQKLRATQKCKQTVSNRTCLSQMLTNFVVDYILKV